MSDHTSLENPSIPPEYVIKVALAGREFRDRRAAEMAVIVAHNVDRLDIKPLIVVRGPAASGKTTFVRSLFGPNDVGLVAAHSRSAPSWRAMERIMASGTPCALLDNWDAATFRRSVRYLVTLHRSSRFSRPFSGDVLTVDLRTAFVVTTTDADFPRQHPDLHLLNVDLLGHRGATPQEVPVADVRPAARRAFESLVRDWRTLFPRSAASEVSA